MQTLQQELEPVTPSLDTADHPVFRQMMTDPAVAYAQEVRTLRQRVALLEAELAATRATASPADETSPRTSTDVGAAPSPDRAVSEFTQSVKPAVVAVQPATQPVESAAVEATSAASATEAVSDPGFAQAWSAEATATSFAERVAEKAFFQASTVDEESRSWLLER